MAAPKNSELVRDKITRRLQEIADGLSGVLGLCVIDLTTQQQFTINENEIFPQASAIKIPILMEIFRQAEIGKFKLSDLYQIKSTDKTPGSGVLSELGDETVKLSLRDLGTLMIVLSDNTATNILIELAGIENINRMLESLGMLETRLRRRMMDLGASSRGEENTSTPAEAAKLMKLLHDGEFVSQSVCREIMQILAKRKETNLSAGLPAGISLASKPGGIGGVVTEWGIVQLPARPYIVAVMENYGVAPEAANAVKEISKLLFGYFSRMERATPYGVDLNPKN